ncbi:LutC/YkgG family protein [Mucilaginibacter arboris]|uniref:Lactate utilization protein B/C n=1 Tax=Mucilaginibacter arboris TaxID=2682090 RepID=A0A7K1SVZ4_9SPHI|nr:LUD domain-containing protein [Mucilaginibacter arboris]MVN21491.1 lactate utilization protein B/C [Mucilaginibacter arboris]
MQNSRDRILAAVAANKPDLLPLPEIPVFSPETEDASFILQKFHATATTIGSKIFMVKDFEEIKAMVSEQFREGRIVTTIPELADIAETDLKTIPDPHTLENIELLIMRALFGVAENSAVWVTEDLMQQRAAPFICQHLAVVLNAADIVPTMHEAYERIGSADYGFATFIAGPSKTADIEQSLVLGAHGPRSMTLFVLE